MNIMTYRRNSGFTLIELLVVIAIISLISSTVLTTISDARNQARLAANKRFERSVRSTISDCSVAFYNFEGSSNTTVREASGTGPDGTINGDPQRVDGLEGMGQAMKFDGSDDYVEANVPTNSMGISGTKSVTVSAWLYLKQQDGNWRTAFNFGDASESADIMLRKSNNDNYATYLKNQGQQHNLSELFPEKEWIHFLVTYNGSKVDVYVDGEQVYRSPESGNIDTKELIHIGQWRDTQNQNWNGKIDNVRIYSCAFN